MVHLVRNGAELFNFVHYFKGISYAQRRMGRKTHLPHDWQAFL